MQSTSLELVITKWNYSSFNSILLRENLSSRHLERKVIANYADIAVPHKISKDDNFSGKLATEYIFWSDEIFNMHGTELFQKISVLNEYLKVY